jgi:hypothetical protein
MGTSVIDHANLLNVLHDPRQVPQVAPESVELFRRTLDGNRFGEPDGPILWPGLLGELPTREHVEKCDPGDSGGRHRSPAPPRISRCERPSEQGEIDHIATYPGPHPCGRPVLHQNADSGCDLAHAHGAQQGVVGSDADELGDGPRRRQLREPKTDTEQTQRLRKSSVPLRRSWNPNA